MNAFFIDAAWRRLFTQVNLVVVHWDLFFVKALVVEFEVNKLLFRRQCISFLFSWDRVIRRLFSRRLHVCLVIHFIYSTYILSKFGTTNGLANRIFSRVRRFQRACTIFLNYSLSHILIICHNLLCICGLSMRIWVRIIVNFYRKRWQSVSILRISAH